MTHTDPYDGTECLMDYTCGADVPCPLCAKLVVRCDECGEYVEQDNTAHRCGTGKGEG